MQSLRDLEVLVVDCQTTGASPAFGSVLEIAWAVVRAGATAGEPVHAYWIALPEGREVPERVQKLTGYDPARHGPLAISDTEAWRQLLESLPADGAMPTAIHYARFELPFLRDWSARFAPDAPFLFDAVCVHAVACRLYPSLPRQNLRALAGYLGHGLDLTRSALGHVQATAFVWKTLCSELANRGIDTWPALREFVRERAPKVARSRKPQYPLDRARYKTLPDAPGVYRFLRRNGDVLYVGKAASLRKRATSHFMARGGSEQAPEMLTQVSDIAVTVTASALEAAVLEHDTIKALKPPYNLQLTSADPRVWFSSLDFDSVAPEPDEAHPLGPLPSSLSLRPLAAVSALLNSSASTASLRAGAVGVSALWTPDEAMFASGFAEFRKRHEPAFQRAIEQPRRTTLGVAKTLLLARADGSDEAEETEAVPKTDAWDPERVARHVERALAQAYQSYRRARFLRKLHDSDIIYREPRSPRARLLTIRGGALLVAADVSSDAFAVAAVSETISGAGTAAEGVVAALDTASGGSARLGFDRSRYDRLRVLTTELKRINRDGGVVTIRFRRRVLDHALVSRLLRSI